MNPEPAAERVPLREREDLSIFWDNHLRVAFEQAAAHDLPAMVEASLAHVLVLRRTGALTPERADLLLRGLLTLWDELGPEPGRTSWTPRLASPVFDGSVEDPYYFLEQQLARACGIETADLDVQLARSRNDLDAAVFRMILRRMVLDELDLLLQLVDDTAERTDATVDAVASIAASSTTNHVDSPARARASSPRARVRMVSVERSSVTASALVSCTAGISPPVPGP